MVRSHDRAGMKPHRHHFNRRGGGGGFIPPRKPERVPDEKGGNGVYDCRRFSVCVGCRFYRERTEERNGVVFVTGRRCESIGTEISNLGDFIGCMRRKEQPGWLAAT